jgi:hypothetical protein
MKAHAQAVISAPERGTLPALSMRGILKSFNGVAVLKHVDFEVKKGEIRRGMGLLWPQSRRRCRLGLRAAV